MKVMKLVFTVLLAAATAVVAAKEDVVDDRVDAQVVAAGEIDLDSSIVVDNQNQRQEQNVDDVEVDGAAGVGDAEVAPENTAPVVTTTVPVSSTKSDTCGFKHRFDRFRHQNVYVVGVHATHSFESTIKEYGVIFGDYLTATVGQRFDPPISFEVVPYTFDGIFEAIDNENIDFMFTSPSIYSCIGIEVGAAALGTVVNHAVIRDDIYDLDVYAGVMITQAENNNIETIADLKDKIIGSNTISDLMGGQLQFYEMEREGLSYVNDPKQVVFTYDQAEVVRGVLNGDFDVGFVRTDQVEHTTITHDSTTLVDPEEFKVISPRVDLMDNGNYFPFLHTTEVFPEWPLSMLTHVPQDVADEVEMALRNIHVHAELGRKYQASPNGDFPYDYATVEELNALPCDVSKEVAQFAAQGAHDAEIYGFRPPRSYFKLRSMQQDGGFLAKDEAGEWHCIRPSNFYDGIRCPEGFFKRSIEEFELGCENAGIPCKEGYDCFCDPCVRSHEVDIYPFKEGDIDKHLEHYFGEERLGCEKMEVCAHVEQTKVVTIRLFDNKHRHNPEVKVLVHAGDFSKELPVRRIEGHDAYEFDLSEKKVQAQVVEVFFNGEQVPESPIRIIVDDLNCDAFFHANSHRSADEQGNCVCSDNTYELAGECIEAVYFFIIVFSVVFIAMAIFVSFYLSYKKLQNDSVWHINVEELHFNEPPEVIGQGGFGIVILGQYRGTKVAVKRVLPPKGIGSRRGSINGSINGSMTIKGSVDDMGSAEVKKDTRRGSKKRGSVTIDPNDSGSDGDIEAPRSSMSWERNFFAMRHDGNTLKLLESATLSNHGSSSAVRRVSIAESSVNFVSRFLPDALRFDEHSKLKREFISEMRLLSRLRHPCITTVMGAVITNKVDPMLVMEYMEYGSLYDLLHNETMDAGGEILLQITRDIVQGLQFLHASKPPILHGDLKAKNILVDSRFRAKVADFGFSHIKQQKKGASVLRGTPFYMAPEYLRRQSEYTSRCDIYSFSMIMYEMYARNEPFEGEDPRKLLPKICHPRTNKRPRVPESMPPKIEDIMKKCWGANPFFRPSAKDLDYILVEMSPRDAEPLNKSQNFKEGMKRKPTSLYDVFPKHIADALNAGKKVEAESHEIVTVVFSDIVGFTKISQTFSPLKVSNMLDRLYVAFDDLANKHKIFKVETIGDAYMGVTNLEGDQFETHVKQVAEFAMEAIEAAAEVNIDDDAPERGTVQIRVGFHSGPVVSNVIGSLNPRYGLFGDTVNTASRMESNSEAGRILCTHASAELLKTQAPGLALKVRGKIKVKGKGNMIAYWVGNTHYRPALVPIMDVSESDESEITMEQTNVGGIPPKIGMGEHESFGTRDTDEMLSFADSSDRSPVQSESDDPLQNQHVGRISDALIESLKGLMASRPETTSLSHEELEEIKQLEEVIGGDASLLEEVSDSIPFKQHNTADDRQHHRDVYDVHLSSVAEKQLRNFVAACVGMYNGHGFHGMLHVSHVSSRAKAMLTRIVSNDGDDHDHDETSDKSYGLADDKLAQFAIMFAALIHDIDHQGIPNFCLAKEDPALNSRYNGRAIAEQNSLELGWEVFMAPQYQELRACVYTSKEELLRFRKLVVNIVIATDIFDPGLSKRREDRWQRAFDPNHWTKSFGGPTSPEKADEEASLKATVVLELLMQASDIGHTMQHWNVYTTWNQRLFEEMYAAFQAGRFPKDPSTFWYDGEIKFFDDKVIPLAKELKACGIFGEYGDEYLQFAIDNRKNWEKEGKRFVQNMINKAKGIKGGPVQRLGTTGKNVIQNMAKSVDSMAKSVDHMGKSVVKTVLPIGA